LILLSSRKNLKLKQINKRFNLFTDQHNEEIFLI
jgi:23S rRNA U2552 (ribose-2'-O)-methylase RlmE/FtsJ